MTTYAVTGHRPDKLAGGYDAATYDQLRYFAEDLIGRLHPERVLVGMAQGWDQAMAQAAMLRKVPFEAYVPCDGQESVWPEHAQERYRGMLKRAASVVVVSPGPYAAWKMQARNEAMVRKIAPDGTLIALFNGSPGGTANCVRYAERLNIPVLNVWDAWVEWQRNARRKADRW